MTLVNIGLNLVLIPRFSLDGAAFATSFCELLSAAFMLALALRATAKRIGGTEGHPARLISPVAASAAAVSPAHEHTL